MSTEYTTSLAAKKITYDFKNNKVEVLTVNRDITYINDYAPETLNYRVYVSVRASFDPNGNITPQIIFWEDGRWFKIESITQRRTASSLNMAGCGMRYTCLIGKNQTYLFFDDNDNRWYVERKRPGKRK